MNVGAAGCWGAAGCSSKFSFWPSKDLVLWVESLVRAACIPRADDDGAPLLLRLWEFIRDGGSWRTKGCEVISLVPVRKLHNVSFEAKKKAHINSPVTAADWLHASL